MPKSIPELSWHDLNDVSKNTSFYRKLNGKKFKDKIVELADGVTLYRIRSQYFGLDTQLQRVTYFMHYRVDNNGRLGNYVWQSLVWSYEGVAYISGIPQKIFFEQLLPKFGTIITDSEQTWNGQRFWRLRLREAFDAGLKIYYCDFQHQKIIPVLDYQNFEKVELSEDIWGPSDIHKMKRMIISTKDLPLK